MQVRVGVYNLAGGKGSGEPEADAQRLGRLLNKIERLGCDLLGLVEVRSNPQRLRDQYPDAAERVTNESQIIGYHTCFGPALAEDSFPERVEKPREVSRGLYQGNMILSRFPIARYHSFLISDFARYKGGRETEPRHLLLALIDLPDGGRCYFAVTHLHTIEDRDHPRAAIVRKRQCERILTILNDLPDLDRTPIVLVGDFNNNPHLEGADNPEPEIQLLSSHFKDISEASGPTRIRRKHNPNREVRIDRVFADRQVRLVEVHPDNDKLDSDESTEMFINSEGERLSDHRPVAVTIDLGRSV